MMTLLCCFNEQVKSLAVDKSRSQLAAEVAKLQSENEELRRAGGGSGAVKDAVRDFSSRTHVGARVGQWGMGAERQGLGVAKCAVGHFEWLFASCCIYKVAV